MATALRCMHCRCCLGGLLKRVWVVCERRRVEGCVASHTSTGAATEAVVLEETKERQEFKDKGPGIEEEREVRE